MGLDLQELKDIQDPTEYHKMIMKILEVLKGTSVERAEIILKGSIDAVRRHTIL